MIQKTLTRGDTLTNTATDNTDIKNFLSKLSSFGIKGKVSPDDVDGDMIFFELDEKRTNISFYRRPTTQNFEGLSFVAGSKKFRQAVFSLDEPARTHSVMIFRGDLSHLSMERPVSQADLRSIMNISLPPRTKFELFAIRFSSTSNDDTKENLDLSIPIGKLIDAEEKKANLRDLRNLTLNIRAIIPPTKQYFLTGYDEKHMFISTLPKKASTVEEAHKILVPKVCKSKKYIRQGEFFFIPVPSEKLANIWRNASHINSMVNMEDRHGYETDHCADVHVHASGKDYILGNVTNARHKTVTFHTLHQVVSNNELDGNGGLFD